MERVVLSLIVSNHFGVLTRVTNLFSCRGYNIETLAVGETENPKFSRITITTSGEPNIINQIKLQLDKLEDVKKIVQIPDEELFTREVILIKVEPKGAQQIELRELIDDFYARKQIVEGNCWIVELTATPATVNEFVQRLQEFNIVEISRTGGAALQLCTESVY